MQKQVSSAMVAPMHAKPTAEVVDAWISLLRTERTLIDKVEDWFHVLNEVDRAPKSMLRQAQVQERTQLAQYTLCRLVDRLERDGLMERHPCQRDGRNNVLLITAKGRALRRSMWPVYAAAIDEHFGSRLTRAEAEQLARLLAKLDGA